jgi:pyrroloquinoline quinone biosynthesis protein E
MAPLPSATQASVKPPFWLLAELTYRCPLHCAFCSNPVDYARHDQELDTATWKRVLAEARAMGAVQLGFSGGEPLLREDLEELVAHAHGLGFYTNLITSGIGLTEARARALKEAGLDHIQLSFQDSTRELNDFISSTRTFELKNKVAGIIKSLGYPMVLNCVMHRFNLPHVGRIIEMAERMGADYLELANTQYYGWAWLNREALMPTRDELRDAEAMVMAYRERGVSRMKVLWVSPDYADAKPKPCMAGWGRSSWWWRPMAWRCPATARACCRAWTFPTCATPRCARPGSRARPSTPTAARAGWTPPVPAATTATPTWRLPLPGLPGDRRCGGHRPGLPQEPGPRPDRRGARRGPPPGRARAPLRFVPGAAKAGGLVFRGDAASLALSADPGAHPGTDPASAPAAAC